MLRGSARIMINNVLLLSCKLDAGTTGSIAQYNIIKHTPLSLLYDLHMSTTGTVITQPMCDFVYVRDSRFHTMHTVTY